MVEPGRGDAPDAASDGAQARPRGRRARGEDTRAAIIEAARLEFLERGYESASMRAIARRAGVDAALVRYWFPDGRSALFAASLMDQSINPARIAESVASGPLETLGVRLVEAVLNVWEEPAAHGKMRLLLRSVTSGADLPGSLRQYLMAEVFSRVYPRIPGPDAALRVNLAMSQVLGLLVARYLVGLEPLASTPPAEVARYVGPILQRYFTPDPADPTDPSPPA